MREFHNLQNSAWEKQTALVVLKQCFQYDVRRSLCGLIVPQNHRESKAQMTPKALGSP
jgi:hypothetical protein